MTFITNKNDGFNCKRMYAGKDYQGITRILHKDLHPNDRTSIFVETWINKGGLKRFHMRNIVTLNEKQISKVRVELSKSLRERITDR